MKTIVLVLFAVFLCASLEAEESDIQYTREFFAVGGGLTLGDSPSPDNLGYSISANHYQFIDPTNPDGLYYGIFSSFMLHSAGGVQIADTKFVKIGLRRSFLAPWLGVDLSIAPTAGARITGDLIRGEAYVGFCPAMGIYVRVDPSIDVQLTYEPVINLFTFSGDEGVPNKSYHDLTLVMCYRTHAQVKRLPWDKEPGLR